jgi:nucleoside-diphosphate-sugar epimerase
VDLLDPAATRALVHDIRPTHLVHLAWALAPGTLDDAHHVEWVRASLDLLTAFEASGGSRAVLVGSCFEYDFAHGYCTEGVTPERPNTVYGQAKNSLSRLVEAYAGATELSTAWARIFFVYGPGEAEHRLVPHVIDRLLEHRPASCTHGRQLRDYLHVDDVATALVALLQSEVQGTVNIGTGTPVALRDLIYEIADQLDGRALLQLGTRSLAPDEPPLLVANPTRLRDEVGWRPSRSIADGLRDTIRDRRALHSSPL